MEQLLISNYTAGGAIKPHRFVKFGSSDKHVEQSGDGEAIDGVSDKVGSPPSVPAATEVAEGERLDVVHLGITDIELGGSVTRGDLLASDADGMGVAAGEFDLIGAKALESGAAGDIIRALVYPGDRKDSTS